MILSPKLNKYRKVKGSPEATKMLGVLKSPITYRVKAGQFYSKTILVKAKPSLNLVFNKVVGSIVKTSLPDIVKYLLRSHNALKGLGA